MFYVVWNESDIAGLSKERGCTKLITEVAPDGQVRRELGFNSQGVEVHRYPSEASPRGLFDLSPVETDGLRSTMDRGKFESLWQNDAPD